jgi:outer membrane protein TolC
MSKYFVAFSIIIALRGAPAFGQNTAAPLSLRDAIRTALRDNPEIHKARALIAAAKGRFWSGISLPAPELSLSYEFVPDKLRLADASEKAWEVRQSMDFPTTYVVKGMRFSTEENLARSVALEVERSVVFDVKSAYVNVLVRREQARIAEENAALSEDFSKKAAIRYEVGEGTNIEQMTARVQFMEAKNALDISRNDVRTALSQLVYSLGNAPELLRQAPELSDSLRFTEYSFQLDSLRAEMNERNPDLLAFRQKKELASYDKTLAWSSLLPSLSAAYFRQTRDGTGGLYGASFGISVPLWFLFDQKGRIEEATAQSRAAENSLQSLTNSITLQLQRSFTEYGNTVRQVKLYLAEILPAANEMYRAASVSYDEGEITYLEFIQSKQTFISARSSYITALQNYYTSVFALEKTVGHDLTGEEK